MAVSNCNILTPGEQPAWPAARPDTSQPMLLSIAERLIGVSDIQKLLAILVDTLPPLLNSVYCATYYLNPTGDAYVSGPGIGPAADPGEVRIPFAAVRNCGWETERSPFYVFSSMQLRSIFPTHILTSYDLQTAIQLPLYGREHLMGFISLGFAPDAPPPDALVEATVASVANLAALAMENIHLVEGLRRSNQDLEAAHRQLREAQVQLVENEKLAAIGRMAAAIAHEVNNPLAIIKSSLQLLQRTLSDADGKRLLGSADGEIDRLARIMRSLLDFYRPVPDARMPADLNATANTLLQLASPQLRRQNIKVVADLAPDLPPVTLGADGAKQLLLNLVTNAQDAMPAGGTLTVRTRHDPGVPQVILEVQDTGVGISPANRLRLFEPFFSTKGVRGSGLGLAVSYGLVQSAGGQIAVESEEGRGACFRITLPPTGEEAEKLRVRHA